jgi:hypothetical protein
MRPAQIRSNYFRLIFHPTFGIRAATNLEANRSSYHINQRFGVQSTKDIQPELSGTCESEWPVKAPTGCEPNHCHRRGGPRAGRLTRPFLRPPRSDGRAGRERALALPPVRDIRAAVSRRSLATDWARRLGRAWRALRPARWPAQRTIFLVSVCLVWLKWESR